MGFFSEYLRAVMENVNIDFASLTAKLSVLGLVGSFQLYT